MRVMSRYLLPPILNTMQSPTLLAVANEAFTSPQDCHEAVLLLTCVYLINIARTEVTDEGFTTLKKALPKIRKAPVGPFGVPGGVNDLSAGNASAKEHYLRAGKFHELSVDRAHGTCMPAKPRAPAPV